MVEGNSGGTARAIELRQLRYFLVVAEELHFGRAAERLHIAQPGLSHQIKALERAIGVELLRRSSRGVEVTLAGEAFLEHARMAVEYANRAVTSAHLPERGKTGLLKIGTWAPGLPPVASKLLEEFAARYSDIELEFHPGFMPQLLDALARRAIDVATLTAPFTADHRDPPRFLRLGQIELMVALPEDHWLAELEEIPRAELLKEPFVDWPRAANPTLHDYLHRLLFGAIEHPRQFEVPEGMIESRRYARVALGEGVAVVMIEPKPPEQFPGVVLRPLEDPVPTLDYGIGWYEAHASPYVADFIDVAEELAEPVTSG